MLKLIEFSIPNAGLNSENDELIDVSEPYGLAIAGNVNVSVSVAAFAASADPNIVAPNAKPTTARRRRLIINFQLEPLKTNSTDRKTESTSLPGLG